MSDEDIYDKSGWGDGPWQGEPDRVEWREGSYKCLVLRNQLGALCGYAAVPPGHACYGLEYDALNEAGVDVYDGLSYSSAAGIESPVGHVELVSGRIAGDEWWVGFSCTNYMRDVLPKHEAVRRELERQGAPKWPEWPADSPFGPRSYKDLAFVMVEVRRLVAALEERRERVEGLGLPEWPETPPKPSW